MKKPRVFHIKAWIGCCDDAIAWTALDGPYRTHKKAVSDLYRTRAAAKEQYEDVRRVTITIHRGVTP